MDRTVLSQELGVRGSEFRIQNSESRSQVSSGHAPLQPSAFGLQPVEQKSRRAEAQKVINQKPESRDPKRNSSIVNRQSSINPFSLQPSTFSLIRCLLPVACLLILLLPGCAKTVTNNNPGQTLTITITLGANADLNNFRYFLVLNHDNAKLQGPDLSGRKVYPGYTLTFDGNTTPGVGSPGMLDASSAPNFVYTDFYELSGDRGVSHGTAGNSATPGSSSNNFNSTADPQISIAANGANITFSIPFDPAIQSFQLQLISASRTDYVVDDFMNTGINKPGYHEIPNSRGYYESLPLSNDNLASGLPLAADIRSCTISIF